MKQNNKVGRRVAEARAAQKPSLTQQGLAERLAATGVEADKARVAEIESGKRGPRHLELIALAEILNTSVYWLLTGIDG